MDFTVATGVGVVVLVVLIVMVFVLIRERPRWRHVRVGFFLERERFDPSDDDEREG